MRWAPINYRPIKVHQRRIEAVAVAAVVDSHQLDSRVDVDDVIELARRRAYRWIADIEAPPEQLHTGRHQFGAIQVDRDEITGLAEDIQREFKNAKVVVTVVAGTEQSRYRDSASLRVPVSVH